MFTSVSLRTAVALAVVAVSVPFAHGEDPVGVKKVTPQFRMVRPGIQNPAGSFESSSNDEPVRHFSTRPGLQNPTGTGGFGDAVQPRSDNRPGLQNAGNAGF